MDDYNDDDLPTEMSVAGHEAVPVCGDCGDPLTADYDGEMWHTKTVEAQAAYRREHYVPPEPFTNREKYPELKSYAEQVEEFKRTGVIPDVDMGMEMSRFTVATDPEQEVPGEEQVQTGVPEVREEA